MKGQNDFGMHLANDWGTPMPMTGAFDVLPKGPPGLKQPQGTAPPVAGYQLSSAYPMVGHGIQAVPALTLRPGSIYVMQP